MDRRVKMAAVGLTAALFLALGSDATAEAQQFGASDRTGPSVPLAQPINGGPAFQPAVPAVQARTPGVAPAVPAVQAFVPSVRPAVPSVQGVQPVAQIPVRALPRTGGGGSVGHDDPVSSGLFLTALIALLTLVRATGPHVTNRHAESRVTV